ncbi:hypothetical protein SapgrDRAFT_2261 [Saprospira grandis DSM 2844]|uniref:MORN repeat protein n=1 Tax=Saprospira grandis DSM 2844 TaxID=694433 RepID=J1I592_9BACT|nr:hypothetical protein [Saprospira grandis]EJF53935.1 hypothetical protein SapgrDRAFT_2261 [Saprospira grandis DSM 2844]
MYKYILIFCLLLPFYLGAQSDSSRLVLRSEYSLVSVKGGDSLFLRQMYNSDTLVEAVYIQGGKIIGQYKSYHSDGSRKRIGTYDRYGRATGEWKSWHIGGNMSSELNYKDGGLNGAAKFYYSSGRLREEGRFMSRKTQMIISGQIVEQQLEARIGEWKSYHLNGKLKSKGDYWWPGIKDRSYEDYWEEQGSMESGEFIQAWEGDLRHGEWKFYSELGILEKVEYYHKGELTERNMGRGSR